MHIAINCSSLRHPLTGIGNYTYNLAHQLMILNNLELTFLYGLSSSSNLTIQKYKSQNIRSIIRNYIPNSYSLKRFLETRSLQSLLKKKNIDIYHDTNNLLLDYEGISVLTVHDLSWIKFPNSHPVERVKMLNKYFEKSIQSANHIITDTQYIKNELIEYFNIDEKKISPIHLGINSDFQLLTNDIVENYLKTVDLSIGKYWLTVGTLEPRKNLQTALNAFLSFPKKDRQQFPLVLVGSDGWLNENFKKKIEPYLNSGEIIKLGYCSVSDLVKLYNGACGLIYPSLYEGFGLPPIEAIACGCPVISSNAGALKEVLSVNAIFTDPFDDKGIYNAMISLKEANKFREKLVRSGLDYSAQFDWKKCAMNTYNIYKVLNNY